MMTCWDGAVFSIAAELDDIAAAVRADPKANAALGRLATEHKAWVRKRNADCKIWENEFPGGSLRGLPVGKCRYEAGRKRLEQFKAAGYKPAPPAGAAAQP